MSWRRIATIVLTFALIALAPLSASAQDLCPNNRVANGSFEEGSHAGGNGAPAASVIANGWNPWSVWGDNSTSRQAEFDIEDITRVGWSLYHVHSGHFAQKFSTSWGTHNAGLYQRVAVPKGSTVTFSAWVQIYTGENVIKSNDLMISDLDRAGNYRAYVGIDPFGEEPGNIGTPPSQRTVWSESAIDRDTRRYDSSKNPYDAWVQLQITVKAEADHVTVFVRGQPEFGVRQNVSYWDDACLTYVAPKIVASNTPRPTNTPKPTTPPTATPLPPPTETSTTVPPTLTPPATTVPATQAPTTAVVPTMTLVPPTSVPTKAVAPTKAVVPAGGVSSTNNPFLLLLFAAVWLSAAGYLGWLLWQKRQTARTPDTEQKNSPSDNSSYV